MYFGNDMIIITPNVTKNMYFYAGTRNDVYQGGSGVDRAFAEDETDSSKGGAGPETLARDTGNDTTFDVSRSDLIAGNQRKNSLYGGADVDSFDYQRSDTPSVRGADKIIDWQSVDFVCLNIAVIATNYAEKSTTMANVGPSRSPVEKDALFDGKTHAYTCSITGNVSVLLSNFDRSWSFKTGAILKDEALASNILRKHVGLISS